MNRAFIVALLLASTVASLAQAIPEVSPTEFRELQDALLPRHPEKWQTVPWKITLLEARDLATKSGKPLFMWSMNGNPLGCT